MIDPGELHNGAVWPEELTDRQTEVARLIATYREAAGELPSAGWLARRLKISRQRASQHLDALRSKGWFDRHNR